MDDVVDAGHGVNNGEDFDFDRNCQGMWHWGDYPVRPRENPQPLGILLSIISMLTNP